MANYKIASIQITFAGGEILNDDRVIKINGELRKIISIDRMVQIHTSIEPSTIPTTFEDDIKVEINQLISKTIGPIAKPEIIQLVPGLPKTRSGKIMRRILRKIACGEKSEFGDISTLLNPEIVSEIVKGS